MNNPWDNLKGAPSSSNCADTTQTPTLQPTNLETPISSTTPAVEKSSFSSPSNPSTASNGKRGGAFFLLALGLGITIFDWYLLKSQHEYYVKAAVLGPLCAVLGLVGLPFPQSLDKESNDPIGKIARYAALGFGTAVGCLNWYLLAN